MSKESTRFQRMTLQDAFKALTNLDREAVSEQRYCRIGVELVYQAGELKLIEDYHRNTQKSGVVA